MNRPHPALHLRWYAGWPLAGLLVIAPLAATPRLVDYSIQLDTIHSGYDGVRCWVHPRAGIVPGEAGAPWWGYALLLGAVVCEASYVVIGKRLTAKVSARRISALINLWGLALVTPFGLWQAIGFDFSRIALPTWVLLGFYSLAASMVTVWLWMKGLQHVPAPQAGVFTVMLPVSAALVGVLFLGEQFTQLHVLAFVLALAGLLLATWPQRAAPG